MVNLVSIETITQESTGLALCERQEWGYTRDLDEEIGERPFMKNTAKDLRDGKAKEFMAEALKKRGLNVVE